MSTSLSFVWTRSPKNYLKSIINQSIFDPTQYSTFSLLDLHHLLPQLAENGRDWDSALLSNMLSQPQDLPGGEMRMPNIGMDYGNVKSDSVISDDW